MRCEFCGAQIPEGEDRCTKCQHTILEGWAGTDKKIQTISGVNTSLYLLLSVVVFFLCFPLGIAAIACTMKVKSMQKEERQEETRQAAKMTRVVITAGLLVGILVQGIIVGFLLMETGETKEPTVSEVEIEEEPELEAESEEPADAEEEAEEMPKLSPATQLERLSDVWTDYTIAIGDTILTFPCEVSALEKSGYTMEAISEDEEGYQLAPYCYTWYMFTDPMGNVFTADVINLSDEERLASESWICSINVSEGAVDPETSQIRFPGEVCLGMRIDEAEAVLGKPDVFLEEEYGFYAWYQGELMVDQYQIKYDLNSKKIIGIKLDRFE